MHFFSSFELLRILNCTELTCSQLQQLSIDLDVFLQAVCLNLMVILQLLHPTNE